MIDYITIIWYHTCDSGEYNILKEKKEGSDIIKDFRILVYNGTSEVVYDNKIKSENENAAIISLLTELVIYDGDSIKIEEL